MAILIIERGREKGKTLPLPEGRTVIVGRERTCDLVVAGDLMASRRHCAISAEGGHVRIKDLDSSNGTVVNGRRLATGAAIDLELEDRIRIGQLVLALAPDAARDHHGIHTGQTIGGYEIGDRIGRGSTGTVYRARQVSLDRTVAVKVLARELTQDPRRVEAFASEAKAAGRLNHPNIVSVFDVGAEAGVHYFSMEHMEQGSVEDLIEREGPLPLDQALRVALDAARGLAYAERQGIVHRDIKPANLMLNAEGVTKIGDLGIARSAAQDGDEALSGSPLYVAPEQARGGEVDHRTDLYSLGVTLFHMLAGRVPFEGKSVRAVVLQHLNETPPRLDALDPEIPAEVADLVADLLEKDPADRPQRAEMVIERLEALRLRFVDGATGQEAAIGGAGGEPILGLGRGLVRLAVMAAVAVAVVVGLATALVHLRGGRQPGSSTTASDPVIADPEDHVEELLADRRASAERALEAAHAYAIANPSDLAGVRDRYRAVVDAFPDLADLTAAAAARAAFAEATLVEQERVRADRVARERRAAEAADRLAAEVDAAAPEALKGLLERAQQALAEHGDTEARPRFEGLRPAIERRVLGLVMAKEAEARAHVAAGRPDEARAIAAAIEGWQLDPPFRLAPVVEALRREVDDAERRAAAERAAAAAKQRADEMARIRAADDAALRREVAHAEVRERLRALAPQVGDAEARAYLADRLHAVEAVVRVLGSLREHINAQPSREPRLQLRISKSMDGVAVAADDKRITFQAADNAAIEVGRTYASLGAMLGDLVEKLKPSAEDRYGLAHLLHDLGAKEEARAQLDKMLRQEPDPLLADRARRALAGKLWGPD